MSDDERDFAWTPEKGLDLESPEVDERTAYGQSILRRLMHDRGKLWFRPRDNLNLSSLAREILDPSIALEIQRECMKDKRTASADVRITGGKVLVRLAKQDGEIVELSLEV